MLRRIIDWSVRNKLIVGLLTTGAVLIGAWSLATTTLEALPDLSDVQVIVQTDYSEQAPRIIEDQVTYPIAAEMLKVPGASAVRGYSFFGVSFVYVIFEDGTDLYWARSRVLEYLSGIKSKLPATVTPTLGPDATGLGWIFQYAIQDTTGRMTLAELRALQDWHIRYTLTAVPGVSEVATIGGFEKQYQVDLDPAKLLAYGIPVTRAMQAIQAANSDAGAMVIELSEREHMVRGLGYLKSISDIENVVVSATSTGTPVRIAELGRVTIGPAVRRGVADLDGRGDAVGGIVVMRFGGNALSTIRLVKEKLKAINASLPEGVVITPVYDRSSLILDAIHTLRGKLLEESLIVALVCLVFLMHATSALVAVLTLPVGILMAFAAMRGMKVGADIMSLGGIAIAIGAMIDASIVMIENMHKHLERLVISKHTAGEKVTEENWFHTDQLTAAERWKVVVESAKEVGPALFFSLLIITVSFLPVFTLSGQEGRLFKPLAFTKTFSMAAASLLSVTLVPVAMGMFIRGRIYREDSNPVNRVLKRAYGPMIRGVLRNRWLVIASSAALCILTLIPWSRIGSEFMPPLDEGTILFMPTTLPGVSVARAREILRIQDQIVRTFPEVERVWGKAGRANSATDPAGLDMFETTITLKPRRLWRSGMTHEKLVAQMDSAVKMPGVSNAWTMPIKGRIDMLATGIRTPVGIKIFGPDLIQLEQIGRQIENVLTGLPGTRSVFAERAQSGYYLDIDIDRAAAARHGLNIQDVQSVIATAIGGMTITQTVEGRERYGVRVRYPQELRDTPEKLADVLVPIAHGTAPTADDGGMASAVSGGRSGQIPLGQIATIRTVAGPMVVRTEGAVPTGWVYVDVTGRDIGGYVRDAQKRVSSMVVLPPGYSLVWSGEYEYMARARERMKLVIPATLALIFLLLYFNFRSVPESLIVMLSLPFALIGGVWFIWAFDYNWSVAVAIGFIALAGVAAETGVVMLIYLDHAWKERTAHGDASPLSLYEAVIEGAVERVRPKMMTVCAIIGGLVPILWGNGAGASVMRRIAAPMIGGIISSTALTLLVIPAIYALWKERELGRVSSSTGARQ